MKLKVKRRKAKRLRKLVYDTKKPLGDPNGVKMGTLFVVAIVLVLEKKLLESGKVAWRSPLLFWPFLLLIIPVFFPVSKWVSQHIVYRDVYKKLDEVAHSSSLIDYESSKVGPGPMGSKMVIAGVRFIYEENEDRSITITVYPRGIKNSDRCSQLTNRFQEMFNSAIYSVDTTYDHTTYKLADVRKQRLNVYDMSFRPSKENKQAIQVDKKTILPLVGSGGIFLTGRSGSGKTNLLSYLMLSALSDLKCELFIIDPKRADMYALKSFIKDGDTHVASEINQIAKLLRTLVDDMNSRYEQMSSLRKSDSLWGASYDHYNLRPKLLVLDEAAAMFAEADTKQKKELLGYLQQLVLKGRQAGFFTIMTSQRLSADTVSRDITLQFGTRIIMGQADTESYRMAFPMVDHVTDLPRIPNEPGYGLIFVDNQSSSNPTPFVAPDMSNVNVAKVIARLTNQIDTSKFKG